MQELETEARRNRAWPLGESIWGVQLSSSGRAWEAGFLPRWPSYPILPYSGNSMGNESTQESGLASERKVNITKRKSLPI